MKRKLPEFRIYRNLHKQCFSVMKYNPEKKGYRLHSHVTSIIAEDVEFRVSQAGRNKVIREKQKNVHAFVYCRNYINFVADHMLGEEVYYNPYKMDTFQVKSTGAPIHGASSIIMLNTKCYLND